ncbi:right-handed parallel beta-helix repeat-containing protein [Candidatus Woesearchaeota archaeon]|nr:right-handed parallel beta-helix repeat-containing protein [Candidatus Woesearchaeota archaeon]
MGIQKKSLQADIIFFSVLIIILVVIAGCATGMGGSSGRQARSGQPQTQSQVSSAQRSIPSSISPRPTYSATPQQPVRNQDQTTTPPASGSRSFSISCGTTLEGNNVPLIVRLTDSDPITYSQCSGDGIIIAKDYVTIDCNRKMILGNGNGLSNTGAGIKVAGKGGVTIQNCHIKNFRYGIRLLDGTRRTSVFGNKLDENHAGLILDSSVEDTTVHYNKFIGPPRTVFGPYAIHSLSLRPNNRVYANDFYRYGFASGLSSADVEILDDLITCEPNVATGLGNYFAAEIPAEERVTGACGAEPISLFHFTRWD